MLNTEDTLKCIDEMILSDDIPDKYISVLKSVRHYIRDLKELKCKESVHEEIPCDYAKCKCKKSKNEYKKKSTGKMGKRCIHCDHFEKYNKDTANKYRCIGQCARFNIVVRDTFNGCSQEEGRLILHNFDSEEVAKLMAKLEEQ